MINAGAMATLALVSPQSEVSERFAQVEQTWAKMMGEAPGFDHRTFLAERDTGHGNRGLANLMAARDMLNVDPRDRDAPQKAAEFYFAVCSLEVNARSLAAAGATLANGGVAPYTGERVFSQETAGRVLSVMGHSGMYNDSGEFSGQVGLPAKSGVSGNVMMVVPEKRLAVVTFSPRSGPRRATPSAAARSAAAWSRTSASTLTNASAQTAPEKPSPPAASERRRHRSPQAPRLCSFLRALRSSLLRSRTPRAAVRAPPRRRGLPSGGVAGPRLGGDAKTAGSETPGTAASRASSQRNTPAQGIS